VGAERDGVNVGVETMAKDEPGDVVVGINAVKTLMERDPRKVDGIWLAQDRYDPRLTHLRQLAEALGVRWRAVSRERLDQLAGEARHQGVAARMVVTAPGSEAELMERLPALDHPPLLLVLDGIEDPHNLGACLRSADGAGVDAVIVPQDHSCPVTATVRKVACGAAENVPFYRIKNLARTLANLREQGLWIAGLAEDGNQELYATDLTGPMVLIMGAEGKGMRRLTREACDYLLRIPMHGAVPSLNVSVATGLCLYEARRQRSITK